MAKKKHHHKKPVRRRMNGVHGGGKGKMQHILLGAVGAVGSALLNTAIQKRATHIHGKTLALLQIGIGGAILWHAPKSPLIEGAAWGFLVPGAIGIGHTTGLLNGIGDIMSPFMGEDSMNGDQYYEREMNGISNDQNISGITNSAYVGMMPEMMYSHDMI